MKKNILLVVLVLISLTSFSQTSIVQYYGPDFITQTEGRLGFPRFAYKGEILREAELATILGYNSSSASYYSAYKRSMNKAAAFSGFGLIGGILASPHHNDAAESLAMAINYFNQAVDAQKKKTKSIELAKDTPEDKTLETPKKATTRPRSGSPFPYRPPVNPK